MKSRFAVPVVAALLAACRSASLPPAPAEFLVSEETTRLGLPFSDAVRAGPFLFLSGQVGNVPGTLQLAPGGIASESRQALENIRSILERNGSSMRDVVKCTVFLADIKEWPAFNEVYRSAFTGRKPARSALAASGLALGARVEVECTAYAPAPGPR